MGIGMVTGIKATGVMGTTERRAAIREVTCRELLMAFAIKR
jgi:hypothetical protein